MFLREIYTLQFCRKKIVEESIFLLHLCCFISLIHLPLAISIRSIWHDQFIPITLLYNLSF